MLDYPINSSINTAYQVRTCYILAYVVVFIQRPFVGHSQQRDGLDDPEATINQVLEDGDEVKVC